MPSNLINSIYPISYFSLTGVDEIQYPDNFWWASDQRFATVDSNDNYLSSDQGGLITTEFLEIDLGRTREINYINFDVIRAPVDISIEYDVHSDGSHINNFVAVKRQVNQPFDDQVFYDPNIRNSWVNGDYFFTDPNGDMVHTRFIRIGFTRRDEPWPTTASSPFRWSVMVKHLRCARVVNKIEDAIGALTVQDASLHVPLILEAINLTSTREVRQQFVYPENSIRGDVIPKITGFGLHIKIPTTANLSAVELAWSLYDVTTATLLLQGVHDGVIVANTSWTDIYFDKSDYIGGDPTHIYEVRVSCNTPALITNLYKVSPDTLTSTSIPGTLTWTNNSTSVGTSVDTRSVVKIGSFIVKSDQTDQPYIVNGVSSSTITLNTVFTGSNVVAPGLVIYPMTVWDDNAASYVPQGNANLVIRIWSDVADDGRDVLGNTYRYAARLQAASNILDDTKAGWMSEPMPSPEAVEALYFDVRGTDIDSNPIFSQIDAIQIAPRTPGVRMAIYYSRQNLEGIAPISTDDWDYLLWTPAAQTTYTLRRNETIELPQPINAAFIKLEFTALNPMPYHLPITPPAAPKLYRRYPTWVEDQFNNAQVRTAVNSWFVQNATPVQIQVLKALTDPILEFEYQQQQLLASLALGSAGSSVNSDIVDVASQTIIDPTTASKIYLSNTSEYQNSLLISVDQNTILGKIITQQQNPRVIFNPTENKYSPPLADTIPIVSTTGSRVSESYQNLARTPMWFNQTCRHVYVQEEAEFNKKAYFVGIHSVNFLRTDYTVQHDDPLILEDLFDDNMLSENTWEQEETTAIPDGATVYVSYHVNPDISDEVVVLNGFTQVPLAQTGGPASNILVFSDPNKRGTQFFQDVDYALAYQLINGVKTNYIGRSPLTARLSAPLQNISYIDAGIVIGAGHVPQAPTNDAAIVTGVGVPSSVNTPLVAIYGLGVYGGPSGTYGSLASIIADSNTVIGIGVVSGLNTRISTDADTVIGIGVVSSTDTYP